MAKKKKTKKNKELGLTINIVGVLLCLISALAYTNSGVIGTFLKYSIRFILGNYITFFCAVLFLVGFSFAIFGKILFFKTNHIMSFVLLLLAFMLYLAYPKNESINGMEVLNDFLNSFKNVIEGTYSSNSGIIGTFFYAIISALVSRSGMIWVIVALVVIALFIFDLRKIFNGLRDFFYEVTDPYEEPVKTKKEKKRPTFINTDYFENNSNDSVSYDEPISEEIVEIKKPKKENKQDLETEDYAMDTTSEIDYVPLNAEKLLEKVTSAKSNNVNTRAADEKGRRLIEILEDFDISCTLVGRTIGPSVTRFEIKPDSNVKISRIANVSDNLKMELAARSLRIEAPIPGKSVVGVEIPNVESVSVRMIELIREIPSNLKEKLLVVGLGKDLSGKPIYCELNKMPHLLVAGATGSGKSVAINSIINTILLRCSPNDVRLLLIDPKKVEFTTYKDVPHLVGPIVNDAKQASIALGLIVQEMDARYKKFAEAGQKDIDNYNDYITANGGVKIPRILVIIDELADLMQQSRKEVEASIQRITQLARAAGIHLIVATQRPSTDVITGVIKANIPSRIALATSNSIDSRTIIDMVGAEKLLGNGDMLYSPIGESTPIRVQGVWISDKEIENICKAASAKGRVPYLDAFAMINDNDPDMENGYDTGSFNDNIYDDVVKFVAETQKASTSLVQRKFGIGYNRAARIIDVMEQRGLIGPAQGSKPREVYVLPNGENINE